MNAVPLTSTRQPWTLLALVPAAAPALSVVMPCFNERRSIREIVRRVLASPLPKELIIVDDASDDGTSEILEELCSRHPEIRLVTQPKNRGKGAAVRAGVAIARGDAIIIQDADLEYDPSEFSRLVVPILRGAADVMFGTRFSPNRATNDNAWHVAINRALTFITNIAAGLRLSDVHTCYKAFRRDVIQSVQIEEDRFGFDTEVTIKLGRRGNLRVGELPISYEARSRDDGKKIGIADGWRTLYANLKYGLRSYGHRDVARKGGNASALY